MFWNVFGATLTFLGPLPTVVQVSSAWGMDPARGLSRQLEAPSLLQQSIIKSECGSFKSKTLKSVGGGGGGGTGGREPGRIGAGGLRETGEERAGGGSSKRTGSGRAMQNREFLYL